jgi:hypothetical protein
VSSLGIEESEIPIILAAAEQLLGEESEVRHELVRGLLSGEGEFEGVSRESFPPKPQGLSSDRSDQTRDSSNWRMPSQHHKPSQTLPPLRSLVLRSQNHRKRRPVQLVLVGKHRRRGDFTSCKKASSIILALGTVRSGWTFLKIKIK